MGKTEMYKKLYRQYQRHHAEVEALLYAFAEVDMGPKQIEAHKARAREVMLRQKQERDEMYDDLLWWAEREDRTAQIKSTHDAR